MKNPKKVVIGLSGGVDSSVAALLLVAAGYQVEAVFMRNWDSAVNQDYLGNKDINNEVCEQERDYNDALMVANKLGIRLHKVDFITEYWDRVFTYFLAEYQKNRTPNPDVLCNNEIKFKAFIEYAQKIACDYIAMGHYARIDRSDRLHPKLLRAKDLNKDQSYFLGQLKEEQLVNVLFPIGDLTKDEVRKKARDFGLITADKKDSTGICFIGEREFSKFLSNYLPAKEGEMRRLDGTFIKNHDGLMYYTIGQRKGLGIGGSSETLGAWYVVGKDLKTNTLYVEPDKNHPNLFGDSLTVTNVIWRTTKEIKELTAKFRYRQPDTRITIKWLDSDVILVNCLTKVKSLTPGQACVFYVGEECVGAGFIDQVYYQNIERKYS